MRDVLKVGALIVLAVMAAPFIWIFSRNPQFVFPTWMLLGYAAARKIFGADRQAMGGAFAVICG